MTNFIKEYSLEIMIYLMIVVPVLILGLGLCGVVGFLISKIM